MDRDTRKKRQLQVQKLAKKVGPELLKIPGVRTVCTGLKFVDGEMTDQIVLCIGVNEKRPISDLPPNDVIPAEIEGIETDVFVMKPSKFLADTTRYRPLVGGIQIGNGSGAMGTLGCFAQRNSDSAIVMLSNYHVMMAGKSSDATGVEISQPGFSCCCCCRSGKVGDVVGRQEDTHVDCAIATITEPILHFQEVAELGNITGTAEAVLLDEVKKRGRTTGVTTGVVVRVDIDEEVEGLSFVDQIQVNSSVPGQNFVESGDSGSALLNEDNEVIGLIFAGNTGSALANHISEVESALDITVFAAAEVSTVPPPVAQLPPAGSDGVIRRRDWEGLLWAQTDSKDPLGAKIGQHWNEVWELIQTNRDVGLRWQRGQGPAFAAAFERTTRVTSYRVPEDVDGVSFTQLLLSMASALEQHGSDALKADIRHEAISWIPAVQNCRTADELWLTYHKIKATQDNRNRNTG